MRLDSNPLVSNYGREGKLKYIFFFFVDIFQLNASILHIEGGVGPHLVVYISGKMYVHILG